MAVHAAAVGRGKLESALSRTRCAMAWRSERQPGTIAGMRPDLADLLETAASLLDSAGPLEPLHVAVGGRDVRITFAPGVPLADQRASVDRLAAATGATPAHSNLGA